MGKGLHLILLMRLCQETSDNETQKQTHAPMVCQCDPGKASLASFIASVKKEAR